MRRSGPNRGMLPFRPCGECSSPITSAGRFYFRSGAVGSKLSAVAAAVERVVSLRKDYGQRLAKAEEPAEEERIVAEANNAFKRPSPNRVSQLKSARRFWIRHETIPHFRGNFFSAFGPRANSATGQRREFERIAGNG
jgi:hypothetical protein